MERAINWLRGCVRVEVRGAAPVNMLDRMARANLVFWGAEPVDGFTLRFTVRARDLERAQALAARSLCVLEVLRTKGGMAVVARARRRAAFFVCACLLFLGLIFSSFFIWDIEIVGNERVSDGEIYRALEDCGVQFGAYWPAFSGDMIRNGVILRQPEISWLAVNVSSSRAQVIVRERVDKPELYDARTPVDIVSASTGIITKMNVMEGAPVVKAGQAVLPGELLVTGRREGINDTGVRYVHARAEVEARTFYEITAQTGMETLEKALTGRRRVHWALKIGETRINFYNSSGKSYGLCDKIIAEQPFALEGVFTLPVSLIRETLSEYELSAVSRERAKAEAELKAALEAELKRRLDGRGTAVSTDFAVSESRGALTVTLRAECRENIAAEVPMTEIPQ